MGNNYETDTVLEELISTLQFSGWDTRIIPSPDGKEDYILAQNDNSKIVIKVVPSSNDTAIETFKNFAKSLKAIPYLRPAKQHNGPSLPLQRLMA